MSSTQPRYPTSLKVAFPSAEGAVSERATNISAGGMFVRTERKLPRGSLLSVALELPDGSVPVQAKVIHDVAPARARTSAGDRGVGVQFVATDDAFRDRLERYIQSLVARSKVPVRVLLVARDLLHEKGWTQLTARDPAGSYCLTGALSRAAGEDREAYRAALQSVGPRLKVPACAFGGFNCHCAVLTWNDREGRTKNEVIAKLDEVITSALEGGASA
ncbi:MAG: TIGR02266 family protein [Myxococcales bacterium]